MKNTIENDPIRTEWHKDGESCLGEVMDRKGGKMLKFCKNRHLHGLVRVTAIVTYQRDDWGKVWRVGINSWYCEKCGRRDYVPYDGC